MGLTYFFWVDCFRVKLGYWGENSIMVVMQTPLSPSVIRAVELNSNQRIFRINR